MVLWHLEKALLEELLSGVPDVGDALLSFSCPEEMAQHVYD
jgi:hypothetical protein